MRAQRSHRAQANRVPFKLSLLALALGSALLTACGGGAEADPMNTSAVVNTPGSTGVTPSASKGVNVSGKVMNVGYLGNTQVCADLNDDGRCSTGEPSTTTGAQGAYALTVPAGHRGVSLLALVRPTSIDSASTDAMPIQVTQGWTLPTLLEYEDGATTVTQNITPITATYYARMRQTGRQRLNNQIAMFTRIVFETNVDKDSGKLVLPLDFDHVANPRNTLATRLKAMHDALDARAANAGAPLDMLTTAAMHASWYNTYVGPTSSAAATPVDASRIATFATSPPAAGTTNNYTSSPEYYLAQDFRYFRPNSPAALRMRAGLTETAGWVRKTGGGELASLDSRATTLSAGSVIYKLARWASGVWTGLTVDEGAHFTLNAQGALTVNTGTDYLLPREIISADGNRVSFRNLYNKGVWGFDVADSPGTNFFIEEWVGEQRSYASYYNGVAPAVAPVSAAPTACNKGYPGAPQNGSSVNAATGLATGTTVTQWFATCYDYYTAEYFDQVRGDLALRGSDAALPGANFYDATLKGSVVVAPARTTCVNPNVNAADTVTGVHPKVSTLGISHCNWAVDAKSGHQLSDLFAADGVVIPSWTKYYGTTSFTSGGVTVVRSAGTAEQAGLPQQLVLKLVRDGQATSGVGTLTSPFGAWTATNFASTTENIRWRISSENPNMVLISWPFRDVSDPRVKANTASDGTPAGAAPVLPAGHFTANWNGNSFSVAPSTHTSPNYRELAIVLHDGVFVTGQYYGDGYTYSERYFTSPAMEVGMKAMTYVFGKLHAAGFVDQ